MHELSICQALVRQLSAIAAEHQATRIDSARVRLGPLSGVEPELLRHAFPLAAAGTAAEGAQLVLESTGLRVRCDSCGAESEAAPNRLLCGQCGDWHTRLVSGDELLLASVELELSRSLRPGNPWSLAEAELSVMCDTCGCNVTPANEHLVRPDGKLALAPDGRAALSVLHALLSENDREAAHNRAHFDAHGVLALNLMSSPGAGKTTLLESTIEALAGELRIGVIEGDLETENDARRIRAKGVAAVQITTGSACHLDAHMVHRVLHQLDLGALDLLFIENVGNLVCPASFDLGQHRNVTLLSVTEGDDKPAKYPVMFRAADLVLLTKTDLLPVLDDFDPQRAEQALRSLASRAPLLRLSPRRGQGLEQWYEWLRREVQAQRERRSRGESLRPAVQSDGVRFHALGTGRAAPIGLGLARHRHG